jgi:nucleotide-binding universal stress UspA family protein
MYHRILVAYDGSGIADQALEEALRFCKPGDDTTLRVVHAVDILPTPGGEAFPVDIDAYRDSAMSDGREVLAAGVTAAERAGAKVEPALLECRSADFSGALIAEAERWDADLIVMGTHGRTGLVHLLMGSVAEGVVRKAHVPVLLVHGAGAKGRT